MSKIWPPPQIPLIPAEVQLAAQEGNLVIFVGAGVSSLIGCPSWDELANRVLESLVSNVLITFSDIQQLSHLDARKRLSIASQIAATEGVNLDYKMLIRPEKNVNSKIYDDLKSIGCIYVTTNYDQFLDITKPQVTGKAEDAHGSSTAEPSKKLICEPHQFLGSVLREPGNVIHLHGSVEKPESMIVTTADYLRHYTHARVIDFLGELFQKKVVLFVGYGLEEIEILEHIIRKGLPVSGEKSGPLQKQRFMLLGFYSYQEKTYNHLYDFYSKSFGIYLSNFSLDYINHFQLAKIIDDWSRNIKAGEPLLSDDLKDVKEAARE